MTDPRPAAPPKITPDQPQHRSDRARGLSGPRRLRRRDAPITPASYHVDALWYVARRHCAASCLVQFFVHCILRNPAVPAPLLRVGPDPAVAGARLLHAGHGQRAAISSFKMMLPVFVGFCFCDSSLGSYKKLLSVIAVTFYLSVIGVLADEILPHALGGLQIRVLRRGSRGRPAVVGLWRRRPAPDGLCCRQHHGCLLHPGVVRDHVDSHEHPPGALAVRLSAIYIIRLTDQQDDHDRPRALLDCCWSWCRMLLGEVALSARSGPSRCGRIASILVPFFMIVVASGTAAVPHSTLFSISIASTTAGNCRLSTSLSSCPSAS